MTEMETETPSGVGRGRAGGEAERAGEGPRVALRPLRPGPAGGRVGIPASSEGAGLGAPAEAPRLPAPSPPRGGGPPPAPQHVRGGSPGARLAPPPPLPRRLKQRSPGARPGPGGAAHGAGVGRAPGRGARGPAGPGPAPAGYLGLLEFQ